MNYEGSCVAVCSSHFYPKLLQVIKQLKAVDYSDQQLSVLGRRANVTADKSKFLSLIKPFRHKSIEKEFWQNLGDLLKGKIFFQTSENDSIVVTGELSRVNLDINLTDNEQHAYAEIDGLLKLAGIPKVSFEYYETALQNGQSLLIIQGNYQELKRAGNLLDLTGNINVSLHLTSTA